MSKIYYIRKNHRAGHPSNIIFLDCETRGVEAGGVQLHKMYMGWTWRIDIDVNAAVRSESWQYWNDRSLLADYVTSHSKPRHPLHVIGSNITFDLFASGLMEHLNADGWSCEVMYEKGTTTILVVTKDKRRIRFLALQNWLPGGVKEWGNLLGIDKLEVDFSEDEETLKAYCRRDVEITGRTFLSYLRFTLAHDMGRFRWTAPGQALSCYRHRFLKDKAILHYDVPSFNAFTRAGYYGGRVECRQVGQLTDGPFVQLDVNSMYPAVMKGNLFPGKLVQWVKGCSLQRLEQSLDKYCCMARVKVRTENPAYPKRVDGKLMFPVGEFSTYLCTESLQYALSHNEILEVEHLATFTREELFTDWVNYFYPLKQQYQAERDGVWTACVKLFLNSLYGKFGEQREREIVSCESPRDEIWRRTVLVPQVYLEEPPEPFKPELERFEADPQHYVSGIEWSCLGTYQMTVKGDEGPMSAPAIAAHVTDYARQLLWRYMQQVGWKEVLYCDTDSLIIHERNLTRLEDKLDDKRLGALKIEGVAEALSLRAPKDYTFGTKLRRKGIRSDAKQVGESSFTQARFPGMYSIIRGGDLGSFPIGEITKSLSRNYTKGIVQPSGYVEPHRYAE